MINATRRHDPKWGNVEWAIIAISLICGIGWLALLPY
jgi:hypothetical protein